MVILQNFLYFHLIHDREQSVRHLETKLTVAYTSQQRPRLMDIGCRHGFLPFRAFDLQAEAGGYRCTVNLLWILWRRFPLRSCVHHDFPRRGFDLFALIRNDSFRLDFFLRCFFMRRCGCFYSFICERARKEGGLHEWAVAFSPLEKIKMSFWGRGREACIIN